MNSDPCFREFFLNQIPDEKLLLQLEAYGLGSSYSLALYRSGVLFEHYARECALALITDLALEEHLVEPVSVDSLMSLRNFCTEFRGALVWVLEQCVLQGSIARYSEKQSILRYSLQKPIADSQISLLRQCAIDIDPANERTLALFDHARVVYPEIASGESTAESKLFGLGQLRLWLDYFSNENPVYFFVNRITALATVRQLQELPESTEIKILEVGSGAGSATLSMIDAIIECKLSELISSYDVTEPNTFFRRQGKKTITQEYPDLPCNFSSLDINLSWEDQTGSVGQHDLIYGVNSFHVAVDLQFSLRQAHEQLRTGGWLVIGECVKPTANEPLWTEFVFQVLDSFNTVITDETHRPNPGFLTATQWISSLKAAGFHKVELFPDVTEIQRIYNGFVSGALCAQRVD